MELITKEYVHKVLGNNIKWKKLPRIIKNSNDYIRNINITLYLLNNDNGTILSYIPCFNIILIPEQFFSIYEIDLSSLENFTIEVSLWNIEYLGKDRFPNYSRNNFMVGRSLINLELNIDPGKYKITFPDFEENFEYQIFNDYEYYKPSGLCHKSILDISKSFNERAYYLNLFILLIKLKSYVTSRND